MGISISQVTADTAPTTFLCRVPPGSTLLLSTNDGTADVAWGTSTAVTFTTGSLLTPYSPMLFTNPPQSGPFNVYVVAGSDTHQTSAVVITARP